MTFYKVSTAAACIALLSASASNAAAILIDDFSDFQRVVETDDGNNATSPDLLTGGSMLGGSRLFELTNNTGISPSVATGNPGSGGVDLVSTGILPAFQIEPAGTLNFNAGSGQTGIATITYDARTDALVAGPGLGSLDLTNGGFNTKFFFDIVELTPNFPGTIISITVVDEDDDSSTVDETLEVGFSEFTSFSEFDTAVDFTRVKSLAFSIDTSAVPGFDGTIASISAVPLPLSSLLVLGGLGGLAGATAASKRRRRKAA